MTNKVIKAFPADVKVAEGERAVTAIITTSAVDEVGDVVVPQGMNTKQFEENPLVYFAHEYYYKMGALPVGKCVSIKRNNEQIEAKTLFAERPDSLPESEAWLPDILLNLYQQGVIRGFSVGFMPIETRPATKGDKAKYGEAVRQVISKSKLIEYSVAPMPANPEALATAVAKGFQHAEIVGKFFGFSPALKSAPIKVEPVKVKPQAKRLIVVLNHK
jgi:hypothetical protein